MKTVTIIFCLLFVLEKIIVDGRNITEDIDANLESMKSALQFFENRKYELHLDSVFGLRYATDRLEAGLKNEPDVFADFYDRISVLIVTSKKIADIGAKFAKEYNPGYAEALGKLMYEPDKSIWYPSINTNPSYLERSTTFEYFNETFSDMCISHLINKCEMLPICKEWETHPNTRDYSITHQLLYWQFAEMFNCTGEIPEDVRLRFCTNILRDSKRIASEDYPESDQDLFFEQIGLCGTWGFQEFYQQEWEDKIIELQDITGCYKNDWTRKTQCLVKTCHKSSTIKDGVKKILDGETGQKTVTRVKREEKFLDDGCLCHKTVVALIALASSLRFQAETLYKEKQSSGNY